MDRSLFRSLVLGAPSPLKRWTVTIRDTSKPRRLEPELDENGQELMVQATDPGVDDNGKKIDVPRVDGDGRPVMVKAPQKMRYPPMVTPEGQPVQVEVRQPGQKQRALIFRLAKSQSGDANDFEFDVLQLEAAMRLTFIPGGDVLAFEQADRRRLEAMPAGGLLDDIWEVARLALNIDSTEEEARKNSKGTPSA